MPDKKRVDEQVEKGVWSQIQAIPLLTEEEEIEYAKAMEAGRGAKKKLAAGENLDEETKAEWEKKISRGEAARETLIRSNLRLVLSAAKRYLDQTQESMNREKLFEELFQAGCVGLVKKIEAFDYRKGCRLSTYMMYWIHEEMYEVLRNNHLIMFTKTGLADLKKIKQAQKEFLKENGREPSEGELAEKTKFKEEKVKRLLNAPQDPDSLERLDDLGAAPSEAAAPSEEAEDATGLLPLLLERYSDQLDDCDFCVPGTKEAIVKQCRLDFMFRREQDDCAQENREALALSAQERKKIQLWMDQWHRGELVLFRKDPVQVFGELLTPRTVSWILEQHGGEIPRADMRSAMEAFSALELHQLTDSNAPYRLIAKRCRELSNAKNPWNRCVNWLYENYRNEIYDFILDTAVSAPM